VSSVAVFVEFICTSSLTALHINAEVVRWYTVGPEKPHATSMTEAPKAVKNPAKKFFSSVFAGFGASSTPQKTPSPVPVVPKKSINVLEANSSSVILTIFTANVDAQLDEKMTAELLRSTLKKPPSRLRYELIYVSSTVVKRILKVGSYFCSDGEGRI
jgi:Protein of unknown function (DUF3684)